MPKNSYLASLFRKGKDSILQKVGEEVIEVVISAKSNNKKALIREITDLWFHLLVLMAYYNIEIKNVAEELKIRRKKKKDKKKKDNDNLQIFC